MDDPLLPNRQHLEFLSCCVRTPLEKTLDQILSSSYPVNICSAGFAVGKAFQKYYHFNEPRIIGTLGRQTRFASSLCFCLGHLF